MQTEHLFELTYILLDKKTVTAAQMAEHFGVSQRSIYRWVDALNLAGVPVITTKGKGGGISLAEKYTLDKAVLTEDEKLEILSSVQALEVLSGNSSAAVSKLKAITKSNVDWIKIDFSPWNSKGEEIRNLFNQLRSAIIFRHQVQFDYFSGKGEMTKRTVEPWKIIFKGQAWYLYAYCRQKKEPRFFKLSRIQNLLTTNKKITHEEKAFAVTKNIFSDYKDEVETFSTVRLEVEESSISLILDEYAVEKIEDYSLFRSPDRNKNDIAHRSHHSAKNKKIITLKMPQARWLVNWILSFGSSVKVIEPKWLKDAVLKEAEKIRY